MVCLMRGWINVVRVGVVVRQVEEREEREKLKRQVKQNVLATSHRSGYASVR